MLRHLDRFVPRAGALFLGPYQEQVSLDLSPVRGSYSKHEQASSSCRVVCPTYGGVILC